MLLSLRVKMLYMKLQPTIYNDINDNNNIEGRVITKLITITSTIKITIKTKISITI